MKGLLVAIPKYSRESYRKLATLLPPEDGSIGSYEHMLANLKKGRDSVIMMGNIPHEIEVEPETVKKWCDSQGIPFNRANLSKYLMVQLANGPGKSN